MLAVRLQGYGGPGDLAVVELPDPRPEPHEVLVRVARCGLNRADVSYTYGEYGGLPRAAGPLHSGVTGLPAPMGIQCSGTVVGVGERADERWDGGRVVIIPRFGCGECRHCLAGEDNLCHAHRTLAAGTPDRGGLDQLLCVPATHVVELPASMTLEQGAAVAADMAPAWWIAYELAGMRPGMRVVVKGASGNVGLAVLAIARFTGAEGIAVTRTDDKVALLEEAGAARVLVADPAHANDAVHEATDGHGADIVVEPFGGDSFADSLECATHGGAVAIVGSFVGAKATVDVRVIFRKTLRVVGGSHCPAWVVRHLLDLMSRGSLLPAIGPVLPLYDVQRAFELQRDAASVGKVVVNLEDDDPEPANRRS